MISEIYFWGPLLGGLATLMVLVLVVVGMYIAKPSYDTIQENTGKYFWCCTRLAAMVLKEAFLLIYAQLQTNNGHMGIGDFCRLMGHNNPGKFFRFADERAKLQKDPMVEFLDVSIMCRVLTDVLPSCGVQVPYRLKGIANELRIKRNKICHEDFFIDTDTLKREFANFKEIFSEALGVAGTATGTNVFDRIRCIEEEIDKALAGPALENTHQILSEVSEVRNGRAGSALTATRRSLMSAVRELKQTDAAIRAHFQPDASGGRARPAAELPKLVVGQKKISLPKLLVTCFRNADSKSAPVLIFWSSMGGPRATMLHHLMNEWASKSQTIYGLDAYDLVVFIDGNENINNSLAQCRHPQLSFGNQETLSLLKEMKVLILLHDVEPSAPLLQQFLGEFPQAHFIVTTPSQERFNFEQQCLRCQRQALPVQLISNSSSFANTLDNLRKVLG